MTRILSVLILLLWITPVSAQTQNEAAKALELAREAYRSLTGLKAGFVQTEERPKVGVSHMDEGTLSFSPPDRMRWDYKGRKPHRVVINGTLVWMFTPSRQQVVKREMTPEEFRSGPATLLSGLEGIEDDFTIVSRSPGSGDGYLLDMIPVLENTPYEKISLRISPGTGLVEQIAIHHKLGNITTIAFHDIKTDMKLPDSLFEWDIPSGVEVIEP